MSLSSSLPAPSAVLNVLLVEDDLEVREATQALLEDEGMHVTALDAAEAALAALATAGASCYDLLLTDVILGGPLSGFDVAAAALARHPDLPVVLATGYAGPAGRIPASLPARIPLLLKPFRRGDLLAAIAAARAGSAARLQPAWSDC
jgi:CheY-like chemotaxis protein